MCRPLHFYHKVTLRASVPQNTRWETLLGGCQGKASRGREHPGEETVNLLEKQVCALQTGDNRDGICPFSRDVEQAQPPIKLFTSDRAPLLEPHSVRVGPGTAPPACQALIHGAFLVCPSLVF